MKGRLHTPRGTQRNARPPMSSLQGVVSGLERAMSQSLACSMLTLSPPSGWSVGIGADRCPAKPNTATIFGAEDVAVAKPARVFSASPRGEDSSDTDNELCHEAPAADGLNAWRDKLVQDLHKARRATGEEPEDPEATTEDLDEKSMEDLQDLDEKSMEDLQELQLLRRNRQLQGQLNRKLQRIRESNRQRGKDRLAEDDLDEGFRELMESHVELKGRRHGTPARVRSQAKVLEGEFMPGLGGLDAGEQPTATSWIEPPRLEFPPKQSGKTSSLPWYQELTRGFPSFSSLTGQLQPRAGDIKGLATLTGSLRAKTPSALNAALALALRQCLMAVGTSVPHVEVWTSRAESPGRREGGMAAVGNQEALPLVFKVSTTDPNSVAPMLRLLEQEASCGGARELLPALAELLVSSGRLSLSLVITKWRPVSWVATPPPP